MVLGPYRRVSSHSLRHHTDFPTRSFRTRYAAYGGFFIILSLLWGWILDGNQPDRFDLIGAIVSLIGVGVIMYWPR